MVFNRLLHAIIQDAITPKDKDLSIRIDNKFANEIKAVPFTENKVLLARFKASFKARKFTAEQVRYKSIFPPDNVVDKLLEVSKRPGYCWLGSRTPWCAPYTCFWCAPSHHHLHTKKLYENQNETQKYEGFMPSLWWRCVG